MGVFKLYLGAWLAGSASVRWNFTWSNNQESPSMSRLDNFLISVDWEDHFSDLAQNLMTRVISDHCPIFLDSRGFHHRKPHFKFENMLLKTDGFVDKVRTWWQSYLVQGTLGLILASKSRALKEDLKKLNEDVFGDVGT